MEAMQLCFGSACLSWLLAVLTLCGKPAGVMLPSVTVEYNDIRVEADALIGSAGVPSLFNVARHFVLVLTLCFWQAPCGPYVIQVDAPGPWGSKGQDATICCRLLHAWGTLTSSVRHRG